jgi:UDP-GlcNAc:undecaprenyl-phosphate GlcNAc-1-phosphate transferase
MTLFEEIGIYSLITILSLIISLICFPSIIFISKERNLYDDHQLFRKSHKHLVSRLGGIGIFCAFTITSLIFILPDNTLKINYVLCACIILFSMGIKDDLKGVNPRTKFIVQIAAAFILVILGEIKVIGFYGVLGVGAIPYIGQVLLSVFIIVLIINAFNLIDGINTLAVAIGITTMGCYGVLFAILKQHESAFLAFALMGALFGFLRYNRSPARLFMGDTGSMLIGIIAAVLTIRFINLSEAHPPIKGFNIHSAPAVALAILVVPVFDTFRVFAIRVMKGKSPFKADRNHLHHMLEAIGLKHEYGALVLLSFNIFVIITVSLLDRLGNVQLLVYITSLCLVFAFTLKQLTLKKLQSESLSKAITK